jgi:shikimate kinase
MEDTMANDALAATDGPTQAPERVVLVGLRCSGKTTVGKLVARGLGWDFLDADEELVAREGRPIADIFASDGEPVFRAIEKRVLADLCARKGLVLATGGGAVLDPENIRVMRANALVAHLDAPPETLCARMEADPVSGEQRPALTNLDAVAEMKAVAQKRAPLYAAARHVRVDTAELDPQGAAEAIRTYMSHM